MAEPGRDVARLVTGAIDPASLMASLRSDDCGALAFFVGVVRDHHQGRRVRHLEYEAYPPMAEAEMRRIIEEARARWPIAAMAIEHRTGRLEIGEASVCLVVAAEHRRAALEACEFGIEALKARVPIWKKEFYDDGQAWVTGATPPA
ncbi:MAG: molybdenum cofactor biosynthesis protein MoaE [Candidatus Polarisedimenticolia bacterium]